MRKTIFSFAALLCCLSTWGGQWDKPKPAIEPVADGVEAYLYNADADGFWRGANDWGTRASVDHKKGWKMSLAKYTLAEGDAWDGESYKIMTVFSKENDDRYGKALPTFHTSWNNIWVDAADNNTDPKGWMFKKQADGTCLIVTSTLDYSAGEYIEEALCTNAGSPDTRVYLYNTEDVAAAPANYCSRWYMVSEANYNAHLAATAQYEAAVLLGEDIEKAKAEHPGIDISGVEDIYNDQNSSAELLAQAREKLLHLLLSDAKPDAALDVTWKYVTNPTYANNNNDGWSGSTPGFQAYGNAEFFNANYDVHQTIYGLPGVYRVSLTGYYRAGSADQDAEALSALEDEEAAPQNALLYISGAATRTAPLPFASVGATDEPLCQGTASNERGNIPNNMESAEVYMRAGKYPATSVVGLAAADGTLTIGLKKDVKVGGDDWTLFDDWKLEYLGNGPEAYDCFKAEYLKEVTDYAAIINDGEVDYYCHAAFEAYTAARKAMDEAVDAEAYTAAIAQLDKASADMKAGIEAYAAYYAKFLEIYDYLGTQGAAMEGEKVELLNDYLSGEEPGDVRFPNGGALYILENGTLSPEAILKEIEFMEKLFEEAVASGMTEGQDCTSLITNPHFSEEGGWNVTGTATWPKGDGEYKAAESWDRLCNVSQTITNLPNGLYELRLKDLFRPTGWFKENPTYISLIDKYEAYVFLNNFEAKLNLIDDGAVADKIYEHDHEVLNGYVPDSFEDIVKAFELGLYEQTLYGVVTDGTLTLGVRNDMRNEECWAVWSDMRLTYHGESADALARAAESYMPTANALLDKKCGNEEAAALQDAMAGTQACTLEAFMAFKNALDALYACVATYKELYVTLTTAEDALDSHKDDDSAELAALQALYDEAKAAYEAGSYNNAQAQEANAALGAAITAVKMGGGSSNKEQDVTDLIVNNNFDPNRGVKGGEIEGWVTSPTNGYKEYTCSYNRAAIDLHQQLKNLPAGHYRVTVHTYYRAGYWDEEWARKEAGEETHLTTLYAETPDKKYETKVMNLYEGALDAPIEGKNFYSLPNGKFAPDGTSPTAASFEAGYYLNTLEFDVAEDGSDVTIGLSKTEILANDYEVVGAWNLYYKPAPKMQDVSDLIVNNNFDPNRGVKGGEIEGWVTSPTNGYKEYTCSYNRAAIDLHQELKNLPTGHYKVTVHTYYRAGYWDEEWARKEAGEETHLTTLYAETPAKKYETKVMNLYEGALDAPIEGKNFYSLPNGKFAPDGTSPTAASFEAGYYLNALEFDVTEEGSNVTIGLSKTEILANDYEVVGEWNLYYLPAEAKPEAKDVTDLIVNNNFDPNRGVKGGEIEGWVTSPTNGYKEYTCSYNRAAIDLHQQLKNLPAGDYKVTVHTYYRAGYWDEEWARKEAGEETHLTTLYAETPDNTYETPVMNLWEGALDAPIDGKNFYSLPNGKFAPDGTSPTAASFEAGYYLNELDFTVAKDGSDVTIGLKKTEILANDYEVVGEWRLYYYGQSTGIEGVDEETAPAVAVATGFYSLDGKRLARPQQGINIVKMSDGRVLKVLVK